MEPSQKPPYVSFTTFRNFIDLMRADGVPPRLDASVMRNLSGAVQSQLKLALRFLNLIDADDKVLPAFRDLVEAEDDQRKQQFMNIQLSAYHFLFNDASGEFDIATATPQQFSEKFRETGLNGDTLRKAEAFFLNLASEAGIPVSKRIITGRTSADRPRKTSPRPKKTVPNNRPMTPVEADQGPTAQQNVDTKRTWKEMMLETLLSKFPEFKPDWDETAQQSWLENYGHLLDMIREEHGDDEE